MAQPTQDMDISSSFTPNHNFLNNDLSKKFYNKKITMDERNEKNMEQMRNGSINILENYESQEVLDSPCIKSSEDVFPWLINFNKMICSLVGSKSSQLLEHLLSFYIEKILTSINTYCEKEFHMVKLKNHINNTLTFFHLYWHSVKEYISDCDSYLNGMSVLLGIYIDMELKTFRQTKDFSLITTKIHSALWIYLDNSEKHIFRVLLKLKLITKKYIEICEPIFRKCFTNLRRNAESLTDLEYVRYLLIFKMWKRIKENLEEKKKVNKLALTKLGPRAPTMSDELLKIIPKSRIEQENETLWLLQPNLFDLKTACNNFLAVEDAMFVPCKNVSLTKASDSNILQKSQPVSSRSISHIQECDVNYELNGEKMCNLKNSCSTLNAIDSNRFVDDNCSVKRSSKVRKHKKSKLKAGEVILIDLTEDDESLKISKGKDKKRKCKRRLEWLKMMKKKYKVQKQVDEVKCRNQVEIADAHSTDDSESTVDKVLLEYLPISDNKVSESTESNTSVEQEPVQDNTHYIRPQDRHDYICNKKSKQLKCQFQHDECDDCSLSLKQNDMQNNRVLSLLKLLNIVGQNVKEPKDILKLLRESNEQNVMTSDHTAFCKNAADETTEIDTQGKEELFSQSKSSVETILLSKESQNSIINIQSIKQELPTSTNCSMTEADYCRNASVYVQSDCHLQDFRSMSSHSSQMTEAVKQKISSNAHECTSCCKKTEAKPFFCHNYNVFNTTKNEDIPQNRIDDSTVNKKSICDKNIMCMLSDLDKCMDVLNRIGEHIMTVHAEKQRLECSEKNDVCAVSTTVFGDHITESSVDWAQNNPLTNPEKLSKILELYEKKEFFDACNSKDCCRHDNGETNAMLNLLKCEEDNYKKLMISKSQSKELYSYGKDHVTISENKQTEDVTYNHTKSKLEQSIKQESSDYFKVEIDQAQDTKSSTYDLKNTDEEKDRDIYCDIALQNFPQKSDVTKSRPVDEFENIDILDSILNGDITIEDEQEILEDSQSSLMSPIDYDNSNNVLNCISEFFLQSEHMYTNEREENYITSYVENSPTPLPEGSLGTTGILNSLLDFELTNIDSLPNDFVYSNVQTVNPRLIKKSFKGEIFSAENESELNFPEEAVTSEKDHTEEILLRKDEKFDNDQNNVNNSVDLIEFGFNTNRGETREFPSLMKNLPSFSGQSTVLVNSDDMSSEITKLFPKRSLSSPVDKLNTDTVIEKSYIFRKENTINLVPSFNDTGNRVSPNIYTYNNNPSNTLMNCTLNKRNNFSPSQKHTRMESETSPLTMKQPLDCDLLSSIDLVSCKTIAASQCEVLKCKNSLKQRNIQKDTQQNCEGKQSRITKHELEVNTQSKSCKRKLRYKKRSKEVKKEEEKQELPSSIVQPDQNELNLRCSQLTVVNPLNHQPNTQSTCELPLSSFHMSYSQKSHRPLSASENMYKQLKCVGIQQLTNISQRKQQILLNFRENPTTNTVFMEDSNRKNSQCNIEDDATEDSEVLLKSMKKSRVPENETCVKFSRRNIKIDTDITEMNLTTDKHVTEFSNNILIKTGTQWTLQNIDTQSSKFVKKQMVGIMDEETPAKKKKLSPKFSSTLEANAVICPVNQQETQKKQFSSVKKGFVCTNRRKNMVGE